MQRREACACYVYVYVSTLGQAEKARNLRPVKVKLAYHYYMITMQVWWRCGVELEWGEGCGAGIRYLVLDGRSYSHTFALDLSNGLFHQSRRSRSRCIEQSEEASACLRAMDESGASFF